MLCHYAASLNLTGIQGNTRRLGTRHYQIIRQFAAVPDIDGLQLAPRRR